MSAKESRLQPVTVEFLLTRLGTYGRYQMCVFYLTCLMKVFSAWHVLVISFLAATPDFFMCNLPPSVNLTNESIPWDQEDENWDRCNAYEDFNASAGNNATMPCPNGWQYSDELSCTLVTEFDLVCSNKFLADVTTSVYMAGFLVGVFVIPSLSDLFGRKMMFLASHFGVFFICVGVVFVKNYYVFITLRFFYALLMMGGQLCVYVLCLEWFPIDGKAFAGEAIWFGWTVGYCSLPLLAYFVTDWRYLQLIVTVPMISTVAFPWIIPETLHWLVTKHRYEAAEELAKKVARCNGIILPEFTLIEGGQCKDTSKVRKATFWDVTKTPILRFYAVIMCFVWFVNTLVYYGLTFGATNWAGNMYLNFFLAGVIELPAYLCLVFSLKWWGRRKPHFAFHVIAGAPLLCLPFISDATSGGTVLQTILNVLGKFGIAAANGGLYLFTSEMYPTEVRNAGVGVSSVFARVGAMLAPFVGNTLTDLAPKAMPLIMGGLAFVVAALCLVLPETADLPTLETLDDVQCLKKGFTNQKVKEKKNATVSSDANQMG